MEPSDEPQTPRSDAAFAFGHMTTIPHPPPILSPCIGICHLGTDGYCEGCLRSGDEIARWIAMGEAERRRIVEQVLPQREAGRP